MRFFAYRSIDSGGKLAEGTIQAASADDAKRLLVGGGLKVLSVHEMAGQAPRPVSSSVSPRPPQATTSAKTTATTLPRVPPPTVGTAASNVPPRRFRFAGHKTSLFFFESMARYLRSGIAPNRALEELGRRSQKPWLGERLLEASVAVGQGRSLADALEACACFPTGCVGTIRAGEASGAVPDACMQAAMGCESAHKLWIKSIFILGTLVAAVSFWPFGKGLVDGSLSTIEKQWNADGQLPAVQTAAQNMGSALRRTMPAGIATFVACFVLWRIWLSHAFQGARHWTILKVPILAGRARDESLARASWALTELSRAGLPPNRALTLAADACPNLQMARRFREEAARMREQDRLSTALAQTRLFDPQLVDVIHNGEVAGDVPGAIDSVHRATSSEFQRKDASASVRIYFVVYPLIGLLVALMVGTLYKTLILGEFRIIQ